MSSAGNLPVAVIGCGRIGTLHAEAVLNSAHGRLAAVCDANEQHAEALGRRLNVPWYISTADLLSHAPVKVVTIATPDDCHSDAALAALDAGCHVFCEKPLASNAADARRMVERAERTGHALAVDYNRRFAFGYRKARELVDQRVLGEIRQCSIQVTDPPPRGLLLSRPTAMLSTLLTHHIDLLRWFCGEIASVHASQGRGLTDDGAVDSLVLSCRFVGGEIGAIVAAYIEGQARTVERCELVGTRGVLIVDDVLRTVRLRQTDPDHVQLFRPSPFETCTAFYDTIGLHLLDFLERLSRNEPPQAAGIDGLAGMEIVTAAERSLVTGQAVVVPQ